MDPAMPQYLWLVIAGSFAAFGFGWATGANDVANAFGTSVGAKTLTLRQAVLIAAIFEFGGAMVLGRVSTSTISGGIANTSSFTRSPEAYAYGMVCAMAVGFLWQGWACYAGFNVSATHSIIGGIIGFALVWGGTDAVVWAQPDSGSFPPYKGVLPIVLAWFFSPVLTAAAAALIFFITRTLVLRRANSFKLAFWVLPPFVLVATFINMFFVFTKGAAKTLGWPAAKSAWVSIVIAGGLSFLSAVVAIPYMKFRFNKNANAMAEAEAAAMEAGKEVSEALPSAAPAPTSRLAKAFASTKTAVMHGMDVNVHDVVKEDPLIAAMHERAEVFNPQAENVFGYLQVFSAICVIFAHGAGEVGYMAGPLGAIWTIYQTGGLSKSFTPNGADIWILILSAVSLVIGLATYGYNVTRTMGVVLAKLTPSRGFAAELATALVILLASQFGLPTSSSQCITGGIIGVGLCEGIMGVNWKFFVKQFATWMGTLCVVGLVTAAVFAQGVFSPSKIDGDSVLFYEDRLTNLTNSLYSGMNTTLQNVQTASAANAIPTLTPDAWSALNQSIAQAFNATKMLTNVNASQAIDPNTIMSMVYEALALVQQNSVNTLGQVSVFPGADACSSNVTSALLANIPATCLAPALVPSAYSTTFP